MPADAVIASAAGSGGWAKAWQGAGVAGRAIAAGVIASAVEAGEAASVGRATGSRIVVPLYRTTRTGGSAWFGLAAARLSAASVAVCSAARRCTSACWVASQFSIACSIATCCCRSARLGRAYDADSIVGSVWR